MSSIAPRDIAECEQILRRGSKSFYAASRVLPARVRVPSMALYAFCRAADDAVDDALPFADQKKKAVARLRERLERVYEGRLLDGVIERVFAAVVHDYRIPRALPAALVEGMEWDAEGRTYETIDDLNAYCARVASTVGVMMTLLMGPRGEEVLARACDLGIAMQLTNIARDVGEDARMGRIYIPRQWMRAEGVDPETWLADPRPSEKIASLTARLLQTADGFYEKADYGVPMLPRDCRIAIRAARLIYCDIGRVVRAHAYDSVSSRAVVSKGRKIWLITRALGAYFSRANPLSLPALPETRFLVNAAAGSAAKGHTA